MATSSSHFAAQAPAVKGATGTPPEFAGRVNPSLDRNHWSFDPMAYRHNWLMLALDPACYAAAGLSVIALTLWLMLAVGMGAR